MLRNVDGRCVQLLTSVRSWVDSTRQSIEISACMCVVRLVHFVGLTSIFKFKKVTWLSSPLAVCGWVGLIVSYSLHLLILGSCYVVHINAIVNIMKVYIERNNIQGELIRFWKKCRLYSRLLLRSERVPEPLYVYSLFARWQQLATNKLINYSFARRHHPLLRTVNIPHHGSRVH